MCMGKFDTQRVRFACLSACVRQLTLQPLAIHDLFGCRGHALLHSLVQLGLACLDLRWCSGDWRGCWCSDGMSPAQRRIQTVVGAVAASLASAWSASFDKLASRAWTWWIGLRRRSRLDLVYELRTRKPLYVWARTARRETHDAAIAAITPCVYDDAANLWTRSPFPLEGFVLVLHFSRAAGVLAEAMILCWNCDSSCMEIGDKRLGPNKSDGVTTNKRRETLTHGSELHSRLLHRHHHERSLLV